MCSCVNSAKWQFSLQFAVIKILLGKRIFLATYWELSFFRLRRTNLQDEPRKLSFPRLLILNNVPFVPNNFLHWIKNDCHEEDQSNRVPVKLYSKDNRWKRSLSKKTKPTSKQINTSGMGVPSDQVPYLRHWYS